MDITELILHDHHEQRRMFAYLEDIDRSNTQALGAVWKRLGILLEVHAEAEEQLFYPHLLKIGTGAGGAESVASEVKDVIKDHNDIRDAVNEAATEVVGSDGWWKAVLAANEGRTVAEGLDYVATWNAGMLASDDLVEAMTAFMERRPPRFLGR